MPPKPGKIKRAEDVRDLVKESDLPQLTAWFGSDGVEEALANTDGMPFTVQEMLQDLIRGFRDSADQQEWRVMDQLGKSIRQISEAAGERAGLIGKKVQTVKVNAAGEVEESTEATVTTHVLQNLNRSSNFTERLKPE